MTVIKKEITVDAPPEIVWKYFADPDLLAAWLMRNNFSGEKGKAFQFYARSNTDWDGVLHCRLVDFEPPNKIAFTWNANDIGCDTLVTVDLTPMNGATHIRLVHANFEGAARDVEPIVKRHDAGWEDHLLVLKNQIVEDAIGKQIAAAANDWTAFDLYVAIDAAPEKVISMWTTIDGMERFFVEMMRITGPDGAERGADEPAAAGDHFIWRWHNGRRLSGEYLAPKEKRQARFSFGSSIVAVTAHPYKKGTLLHLRQSDIPDTEEARMHVHVNCRAAWVYFLTILKTLLEKGVDGRDTSRETGASFSTYFNPAKIGVEIGA